MNLKIVWSPDSLGRESSSFYAWSQQYQKPLLSTPLRIPIVKQFMCEPIARGTVHCEKYETEAVLRVIKKFIRDKANRENPE